MRRETLRGTARPTGPGGLARPSSSAATLAALERHRDFHFRRVPARRVRGEKSALEFINAVGFCTAFTAGLGMPCLYEAIAGERERPMPEHIQHDYAIGTTWRLKDTLPDKGLVYYGKALAGRPGFIARELLPSFLRLRLWPGGYQRMYRRGELSQCARLVMDTLLKHGAAETMVLKLASGYSRPGQRGEFDRAMRELQGHFMVLKVEERSDPFTYVWDRFESRWAGAIVEARTIGRTEAAYRIMRRYFEVAAFNTPRAAARLLGIEPELAARALRRLERDQVVATGVRIDGRSNFAVLRELVAGAA